MRGEPVGGPARTWSALWVWLLVALTVPQASGAPPGDLPEPTTHQLAHDGAVAIRELNYPRAAQLFGQAATIDPDFTRAHLGLALAALGRGDRKEFERSLRRADALTHGAPEVRYVLAVQKWMAGDLRAAEAELHGAARTDVSFLEARYALGVVQAARGDLESAASTLREVLLIDAAWASAHFQLGAILGAAGDPEGAVQELREAISIDPDLGGDRPEERLLFADRRVLLGSAHGGGFGLPLPLPRPKLLPKARSGPLPAGARAPSVPEWFLDYELALFLEDEGRWSRAVMFLERALSQNDREETQTPIADRLYDYLPHRHLARASYESGDLREALLHLEIALNQGAETVDELRLLETRVRIASGRTTIVLQPIPDRTSDDTVAIRGLLLSREPLSSIDVGGQKALLRAASAEETGAILSAGAAPSPGTGVKTLYFEIPAYRLAADGPNLIRIRPGEAGPAGTEVEVLIVKEGSSRKGDDGRAAAGGKQ